MIRRGKEPDNQLHLDIPGFSDAGSDLMADARGWAASHVSEWSWYKRFALSQCEGAKDGKASPNFCLQSMRARFRCEVLNAYAAPFARIAMEEDPRLRFRLARSKVDGFTRAVL